jgi:uncharacterized damage-inducible protein DinB
MTSILTMDDFDFTKGHYKPSPANTPEELLHVYQQKLDEVVATLEKTGDEQMHAIFTLRGGEHVIASMPRIAAVRTMAMNHLVHHRGQLSVYLRLLDIPVPGMYGPSADER